MGIRMRQVDQPAKAGPPKGPRPPPKLGLSKKLRSWPGIKQKRLSLAKQHRNYSRAVLTVLGCLLFVGCVGVACGIFWVYSERNKSQTTEVTKSLHRESLPATPKPIVHDEDRKPAKKNSKVQTEIQT